jgi:uracil-DNA glycosylase family protein
MRREQAGGRVAAQARAVDGGARMAASSLRARRAALEDARTEALGCRACPLWRDATQTVFGEGPIDARIVLVGEQPGDVEDRAGHVFVGPAGRVLDEALEKAGIERRAVYTTNAVKHFKFKMRGKRRIHQRPSTAELEACRPWLEREVEELRPEVLVALGASAARSLIGRPTAIGASRGRLLGSPIFAPPVLVTAHPSSVLREREHDARVRALADLASDLAVARSL